MRVRHCERKRLLIEDRRLQAVHRYHRQRKHTDVEVPHAAARGADRLVLVEKELEFRRSRCSAGATRGEIRADGWDERHAKLAGQGVTRALRQLDDRVRFLEHSTRALHDLLPAGVSATRLGWRSTRDTPRYRSSLRIWAERVGWLTKQRCAARPKVLLVRQRHEVPEVPRFIAEAYQLTIDNIYWIDKNNPLD